MLIERLCWFQEACLEFAHYDARDRLRRVALTPGFKQLSHSQIAELMDALAPDEEWRAKRKAAGWLTPAAALCQ